MELKEKMEYLSRYRNSVKELESKKQELQMLESWITKTTPTLSQAPSGGDGSNKFDNYLEQKENLEILTEKVREEMKQNERNTRAAIETIQDEDYKRYLSYYYISFMTWEEAAEIAGYEYRYFMKKCQAIIDKIDT